MAEMANNFGKESRKAVMCAVDVHFFFRISSISSAVEACLAAYFSRECMEIILKTKRGPSILCKS